MLNLVYLCVKVYVNTMHTQNVKIQKVTKKLAPPLS